jgi:hypothetical protein
MIFLFVLCAIYALCMAGCTSSSTDALPLHTVPEISDKERTQMQDALEKTYTTERTALEQKAALEKHAFHRGTQTAAPSSE